MNIVCDHALLTGYSQSEPIIDAEMIRECVEELQFPGEKDTVAPGAGTEGFLSEMVFSKKEYTVCAFVARSACIDGSIAGSSSIFAAWCCVA